MSKELEVFYAVRVEHEDSGQTLLSFVAGPFGWYHDAFDRVEKERREGFGLEFEVVKSVVSVERL